MRPASDLLENTQSGDAVFSITVDDGSRSVLRAWEIFQEYGVHVCLRLCGISTLHQGVLLAHKVNLLRSELGDEVLYRRLQSEFDAADLQELPLRGGVLVDDLYRYDELITRNLKTALNYRLTEEQAEHFVDDLFLKTHGDEKEISRELYLSVSELDLLRRESKLCAIAYHGLRHRLWGGLDGLDHVDELRPPEGLGLLFDGRPYVLSIPYGMSGSYSRERVMRDAGPARGAFTMGRSLHHKREAMGGFQWLQRFDQADLFTTDGHFNGRVWS